MGRFADSLSMRIRGRRVARALPHPKNFKGAIMWCALCRGEVMRMPVNHRLTHADQQAAFDRHMTVCAMKDAPGLKATRREIVRGRRRILRRQWWHRRRWAALALAVLLVVATGVGWALTRWR